MTLLVNNNKKKRKICFCWTTRYVKNQGRCVGRYFNGILSSVESTTALSYRRTVSVVATVSTQLCVAHKKSLKPELNWYHISTCKDLCLVPRIYIEGLCRINFFYRGATAPSGPRPPYYRGSMITLRHTALGRTPPDVWSARCRDFYLTTHNTYKRQTSMPPAGFEPAIPAS